MKNRAQVPGLKTGLRLVGLAALIAGVAGFTVGATIDSAEDTVGASYILGVLGILLGAAGGLWIWLVKLWAARAPLAFPATIGAACGPAVCAAIGVVGGELAGWLLLGVAAAAPCVLAASSITVLAQRYARANPET